MKKYKTKDKMPISVATYFIVLGLILGTVFTIGMQYWHSPIERKDMIIVEATYDSYRGGILAKDDYRKGINVYFSDYETQHIESSCATEELLNELKQLSKGDKVTLLLYPNSSTIWEISSGERTIMLFEQTQKNIRGNNIGFGLMGIFAYLLAAFGFGSLIMRVIRKRKIK